MSEVLVGSPAGTIYGTYADAVIYVDGKFGDTYRAWEALGVPDRKRALLSAAAFINSFVWTDDYDTFTERDALQAFKDASYEMAVIIVDDASVVAALDQGTNIARVYAGGAGVDYFNPTSARTGSAPVLPPILMRLIGAYLASTALGGPQGGSSQSSCADNPFDDSGEFERAEPFD
jgi:hypothetical protein